MKRTIRLLPLALLGLLPCQASNLSVNLGLGFTNTPDEPGFENVTAANGVNGPQSGLATIDGVTISLDQSATNETMRSLDRGDPGTYSGALGNLTNTWAACQNPNDALQIVLGGVTGGEHTWTSYHLDEGNQTGAMDISISVDGGATFTPVGNFDIWDTSSQGQPASTDDFTFTANFNANGLDDVIIQFDPSGSGGTLDFSVVNGFTVAEAIDPDSDGDGLDDLWEDEFFGDNSGTVEPSDLTPQDGTGDPDTDGATNEQEETAGSDPNVADTDGDGLNDGAEINTHSSNPTLVDTDGDGIDDGVEVNTTGTNPALADTDSDGLDDGAEDLNQDGVLDPTETDPSNSDTDGDGYNDGFEVANVGFGFDARVDNSGDDPDADGLDNAAELAAGTDAINADTDGDTILDGEELNIPVDTDGYLTNPLNADTDNDHQSDPLEIAQGTDPTDLASLFRVAELAVDFNSNQDDGGNSNTDPNPARGTTNHNEFGYQSYHANHEVIAEFTQATYPAFGTTITLDIDFPDTTDNRVQQSIDRTNQDAAGNVLGGFDANWEGQKINLLTDWIGVDSRTGNGGNGPYDGTTGTPTRMTMDLGNLPAGSYSWRSFHHDTEHMNPEFIMEVSTDGGTNFFQIGGVRRVTDSTPAGTPASPLGEFDGVTNPASGDPADLPSTVNTCFIANGTDNVQFRYTPLPTAQVHTSFFVMNGFEIDEFPNDSDNDCFDDTDEFNAFGDLDEGPFDDSDSDGLDNITEIILGTNPAVADSDGDGLNDGGEVTAGTDPSNPDSDGDGLTDGDEVNVHFSDPLLVDTDGDGFEDGFEVTNVAFGFDVLVDDSLEDADSDGRANGDELFDGTDPLNPDTDGDGLNDGDEFNAGTNPLDPDTDLDGLTDGDEVNVYSTDPLLADSDGDGFEDGFEVANNPPFDPNVDNSAGDFDTDGLTNAEEATFGTNPLIADTDGDGLNDGDEVNIHFSDPLLVDTDGDGLSDGDEVTNGTSPISDDSDGDGDIDPEELLAGSDPNDNLDLADNDLDGYNNARETAAGTDPDDFLSFPTAPAGALFVDFNSNQSAGPKPQDGYQSYDAQHEVIASFVTQAYTAFGTSVDFTPSWPDTTDSRVQQMIGRGGGNDANWHGDQISLLTDWIGTDTRTGGGGLGNYDGVTGTPTPMLFTFSGLPAGSYNWRSYHHDTENMHTPMTLEVSTDGGVTFGPAIQFDVTDSTPGGSPNSAMTYDGAVAPGSLDPADLPSTVTTSFTATGSDDVVLRWIPLANTAVHRQFAVVNGFELTETPVVPAGITLTDVGFNGANFDVTGEGFDTGLFYQLKRSTDGMTFTDVGGAFNPAGSMHTASDPAPTGAFALYQFFEVIPK